MAAEYLPGTPGERIRDLRKEAKLNQDDFAEAIGISRSTLGDIELDKRSISSTTALEIAKYFNVSVDFVLAKTDDPNIINYDLKVLGLTQEAADKLYTNQIDTGVLNLLIEHEKFGEMMHLIAFYLKDINSEAKRTQNALYSTIADFLRKYGEDENADTVAAKKEPVYSADISKIQNCLNIVKCQSETGVFSIFWPENPNFTLTFYALQSPVYIISCVRKTVQSQRIFAKIA